MPTEETHTDNTIDMIMDKVKAQDKKIDQLEGELKKALDLNRHLLNSNEDIIPEYKEKQKESTKLVETFIKNG